MKPILGNRLPAKVLALSQDHSDGFYEGVKRIGYREIAKPPKVNLQLLKICFELFGLSTGAVL